MDLYCVGIVVLATLGILLWLMRRDTPDDDGGDDAAADGESRRQSWRRSVYSPGRIWWDEERDDSDDDHSQDAIRYALARFRDLDRGVVYRLPQSESYMAELELFNRGDVEEAISQAFEKIQEDVLLNGMSDMPEPEDSAKPIYLSSFGDVERRNQIMKLSSDELSDLNEMPAAFIDWWLQEAKKLDDWRDDVR